MDEQAQQLIGRRIVLTGASRGLGRVLAERFHAEGATLCLLARASAEFDTLIAELDPVAHAAVDLADPEAALFVSAFSPDVLVNNAAQQGPIGPLAAAQMAAWQRTIAIDLVVPAALMAAALPGMVARGGGVIVNLSGGGAATTRPYFSAYAAAKAGLVRLTECVADEVRPQGIAVIAVAPGALPTRMLQAVVDAGVDRSEIAAARRVLDGSPDDNARAFATVAEFLVHAAARPRMELSGRLVAPRWDTWQDAHLFSDDALKLRRTQAP